MPIDAAHGPVHKEPALNAHERVVSVLERLVFGGAEPGSPLPSESELADELSVSRLTVREAIKSLQARGLIQVRHGRRPVIAPLSAIAIEDFFSASVRTDPRNYLDLLEARRAIETHIAGLAAIRSNRTAILAMEDALTTMRASIEDTDAFNAADVRFHEALAAASGNRILTFLIEAMQQPLHNSRMQSQRGHVVRGRPLVQVIDEHAAILRCVREADPAGAAAAMRDHLAQTEHSLYAALGLPSPLTHDDAS